MRDFDEQLNEIRVPCIINYFKDKSLLNFLKMHINIDHLLQSCKNKTQTQLEKKSFYEKLIEVECLTDDILIKELINTIKRNFKTNRATKIISKNLYINLLNVKDIVKGLKIILQKKAKPGQYIFKNSYNLKIYDLIKKFNKLNVNKIRVKWMSNKIIKNKILKYNQLKYWRPISSNVNDIVNYIKY